MEHRDIGGSVTPTGKLIAAKVVPHEHRGAGDTATMSDAIKAEVSVANVVIAVRIEDQHTSVAADVDEDGTIVLRLKGAPSEGEAGAFGAATRLVAYLNSQGASWEAPIDVSADNRKAAIDAEARGPNDSHLQIQVVRADITQSLWRALGAAGAIEARYSVEELAERVIEAIDKKRLRADPTITLALDAGLIASHAFEVVAIAVRAKLIVDSSFSGYAGLWLIGPTERLVWRLDPGAT